jgi:hypothetical protein
MLLSAKHIFCPNKYLCVCPDDGPMLQHGLQELQQTNPVLPRDKQLWPDQQLLDVRYQRFILAS